MTQDVSFTIDGTNVNGIIFMHSNTTSSLEVLLDLADYQTKLNELSHDIYMMEKKAS